MLDSTKKIALHVTLNATLAASVFALSALPAMVFAQDNDSATTNTEVDASASGAVKLRTNASLRAEATTTANAGVRIGAAGTAARAKAEKEIDRRIAALGKLGARVDGMVRVSDSLKQAIKANNEAQVKILTDLKVKIAADEDIDTLKADIKSITQSYRVFALVIPQGHITAAADRIANITVIMQNIGTKLQARVEAAGAAGTDVTAATASLVKIDANIKLAQAKAIAAVNAVVALTPDNGDTAKREANLKALKAAQAEIKAANKILVDTRKEFAMIVKSLGSAKASATATTSASIGNQ